MEDGGAGVGEVGLLARVLSFGGFGHGVSDTVGYAGRSRD